jgi:hypothetical protein
MLKGLFFLVAATAAFAQTATVNGIVTDSTDAIIVGARLEVTNLDTGLRREAETNDAGAFSFNLLPVGRYRITANANGFGPSERPEIKLDVDQVPSPSRSR